MEMSIADDADGGPFVAFDGEIQKLHNMRAYEAGHLMVRSIIQPVSYLITYLCN